MPKYAMMGNTPTAASNGRRPSIRPPESGGSPGEADDEIVASRTTKSAGHPALLPVSLVHPEHHQPAAPPGDRVGTRAASRSLMFFFTGAFIRQSSVRWSGSTNRT